MAKPVNARMSHDRASTRACKSVAWSRRANATQINPQDAGAMDLPRNAGSKLARTHTRVGRTPVTHAPTRMAPHRSLRRWRWWAAKSVARARPTGAMLFVESSFLRKQSRQRGGAGQGIEGLSGEFARRWRWRWRWRQRRGLRGHLCARAGRVSGASSNRTRVRVPALSHLRDQSRALEARMVAPAPRAHHEEVAGTGPTSTTARKHQGEGRRAEALGGREGRRRGHGAQRSDGGVRSQRGGQGCGDAHELSACKDGPQA